MTDQQMINLDDWRVKRGDSSIQEIPIKDADGNLVTDLDQTSEVKFQVKTAKSDTTPKIAKTKGSGVEVNQPSSGYVRITLEPTDTDIDPGDYYMALQIEYNDGRKYEVNLKVRGAITEKFVIVEDIID